MNSLDESKQTVYNAVEKAADKYGVEMKHILGRGRQYSLVEARQYAMTLASNDGVTDGNIGMWMDRDASTVWHNRKTFKKTEALRIPFKSVRNTETRKETQ